MNGCMRMDICLSVYSLTQSENVRYVCHRERSKCAITHHGRKNVEKNWEWTRKIRAGRYFYFYLMPAAVRQPLYNGRTQLCLLAEKVRKDPSRGGIERVVEEEKSSGALDSRQLSRHDMSSK